MSRFKLEIHFGNYTLFICIQHFTTLLWYCKQSVYQQHSLFAFNKLSPLLLCPVTWLIQHVWNHRRTSLLLIRSGWWVHIGLCTYSTDRAAKVSYCFRSEPSFFFLLKYYLLTDWLPVTSLCLLHRTRYWNIQQIFHPKTVTLFSITDLGFYAKY